MLQFRKHNQPVRALAFSPDSAQLAACSERALDLWDVATGTAHRCGRQQSYGPAVQFDPSGRWLFASAATRGFLAIDTQTRKSARAGGFQANLLTVAPTGDRAVFGHQSLAAFEVTKNGGGDQEWLHTLPHTHVQGLDFFPDGKRFVSVEFYQLFGLFEATSYLRIRSAADGRGAERVRFRAQSRWAGARFAGRLVGRVPLHELPDRSPPNRPRPGPGDSRRRTRIT